MTRIEKLLAPQFRQPQGLGAENFGIHFVPLFRDEFENGAVIAGVLMQGRKAVEWIEVPDREKQDGRY